MKNICATGGTAGQADFVLLWKKEPEFTVEGLHIDRNIELKAYSKAECAEARKLVRLIKDFLLGRTFNLPVQVLNTSNLPPFHKTVLFCLHEKVPPGKVVSYGKLAAMAGSAKAGRAVGQAMSKNPFPLFLPCHRVLNSDRRLGNYGPGPELKKRLLQNEGVHVGNNDIVAEEFFI